jgi:hypothetical protein
MFVGIGRQLFHDNAGFPHLLPTCAAAMPKIAIDRHVIFASHIPAVASQAAAPARRKSGPNATSAWVNEALN